MSHWMNCRKREDGKPPRAEAPIWENPWQTPDGQFMPEILNAQDMMVMITQVEITDHTAENLAESDRGVASLDWAANGQSLWASSSTFTGTQALLNIDLRGRVR